MARPVHKRRPASEPAIQASAARPASPRGANPALLLQRLAPPQAVVHVGAGTGQGEVHQWRTWGVTHAAIIDADAERLVWSQEALAQHPEWLAITGVVGDQEADVDYYRASNPDEDGLVSPNSLNALWPNLAATEQELRPAQRLDRLLEASGAAALIQTEGLWLIVDCLPALPILEGAGALLDHAGVLWLRVLLQPVVGVSDGALLDNIEAFLTARGYRRVHLAEGNHPATGHALFVHDWHKVLGGRIQAMAQARDEQAGLAAERQNQIEALNQAMAALDQEIAALAQSRDEQARIAAERQDQNGLLAQARDQQAGLATDRQQQIEALSQAKAALEQEKSALAARRDALDQEVAALTQAHDEQARLAAERQEQIVQITQTRDQQAGFAGERQQQIEALSKAKAALEQEKSALAARRDALDQEVAALTQARDAQAKLAVERQEQIEALSQTKSALEQEKSALAAHRDALDQEVAALTQARDAQAKLAAERQQQIEALHQTKAALEQERTSLSARRDALAQEVAAVNQARDAQAKLATERQQQIEALHQAKAVLEQEKSALVSRNGVLERDNAGLAARITETEGRIKQKEDKIIHLEQDLAEREMRQHMLNDEITRAEAQIDLIKDVLLREPGL